MTNGVRKSIEDRENKLSSVHDKTLFIGDVGLQNFGENENLFLIQADIYELPFAENTFPFIYSLGVLQHTPDVKKSFDSIVKFLQSGGSICVD